MTQAQQPGALRLAAICETKGMFPVADELNRMHARILELEQGKCLLQIAEPAAQGLDAARYHWLREQHDKGDDSVTIFIGDEQHGPGHLDAQIDEAIAAQAKQGGA